MVYCGTPAVVYMAALSLFFIWYSRYEKGVKTEGFCSKLMFREQSFSVCTNDFTGVILSREKNFHPVNCSTALNRLNIWLQEPEAN